MAKGLKCLSTYQQWEYTCVIPLTEGLTGKEYKTIVNKSKAVHRHKSIEDLKAKESNDPKAFWNIINRTKHPHTGNVTIDEFFEHFSVLNATEDDDSGLERR